MKLGIDCIEKYIDIFKGKRIGLITNPTGIDSKYQTTIDVLYEKVNLVSLFSPEHGIRGNIQAGEKLETYVDEKTGCIVYSLYGATKRPTKEMMDDIDILCIDIQDVGSRYYTYIYTMSYAMEACKEYDKEFVVFDRPNPINALVTEGNILDIEYRSFVGYYPITQRYGLTIGELANLFNKEYEIDCSLKVIPMENYDRSKYFDELGLLWVAPSPNIPTVNTAVVYNATCIFEGTNISEGRGTTTPFEVVGAPFINPYELANKLNSMDLKGVYFRPMYFTPTFSKHKDMVCGGIYLHILNRKEFETVKVGWAILDTIRKMYPNDFSINAPYKEGSKCMLELETGGSFLKDMTYSLEEQFCILDSDSKKFNEIRKKYILY